VTHLWPGYGSALILEFGRLAVGRRRDGTPGHPSGEMGLMIEGAWRLEGRRQVLCGSEGGRRPMERCLPLLRDAVVTEAALSGRLPEIDLGFSTGARLLSFTAAEGDPQWTLFDRRSPETRWIGVRRGWLEIGTR
jgi:hypothetical protein